MSFHLQLESIQCNGCLAIAGAIWRQIERKALPRTRFRSPPILMLVEKLVMFSNIFKSKSPQYLFNLILEKMPSYVTKNADNIPLFNIKHNFYKNSFFSLTISGTTSIFGIQKRSVFLKLILLNLLKPN